MNRYVYIDNFVAPFVIYPGDVFYLFGTNVCCEVVSVEGNIIGYRMRYGSDDEVVYVTRNEFDNKFEFGYEGELPRMQKESDEYEGYYDDGYDYEPYDWYDEWCYQASKYEDGYEN